MNESLSCGNIVFPPNTATGRQIGFVCKRGIEIEPSNPIEGTFMWDFDNGGGSANTRVSIEHLRLQGNNRTNKFNGIRIAQTNRAQLFGCSAVNVDGQAIRMEGANNCEVNFITVDCGDATNERFAQYYGPNPNGTSNHNDFQGSIVTENDPLGVMMMQTLIGREINMKIHAGNISGHGLTLVSCKGAKINAIITNDFRVDGFIRILDDQNSQGIGLDATRSNDSNRVLLDFQNLQNTENAGAAGNALILYDCGNNNSSAKIEGMYHKVPTSGQAFPLLTVMAGGNNLDTSGIGFHSSVTAAQKGAA